MTFVSFFKRDLFLDLIKSTFALGSEEGIYEEESVSEGEEEQMIECPDDMGEESRGKRV